MRDAIGTVDYTSLPEQFYDKCIIYFPSREPITSESPGLLIEIKRLNIPCDSGSFIQLSGHNRLCGKLEDILPKERIYYFPLQQNMSIYLEKNPLFSLNFKLVDYCYNVTMTERNSSFLLEPKLDLECYFLVHLPYGNRIELNIIQNLFTKSMANDSIIRRQTTKTMTKSASSGTTDTTVAMENGAAAVAAAAAAAANSDLDDTDDIDYEYVDLMLSQFIENVNFCTGLAISISDANDEKWSHCINDDSPARRFSFKSTGNSMLIHVTRIRFDGDSSGGGGGGGGGDDDIFAGTSTSNTASSNNIPSVYIEYTALPIPEIVSQCAFGWIAVNQFCISAIEMSLPWKQAEAHCKSLGGHLASIKSEREQRLIDTLLMNR